jgi:hypothetical protein
MADGVELATAYVSLIPRIKNGAIGSEISRAAGSDVDRAGTAAGSRFGKFFAKAYVGPVRALGAAAVGLFAVDKVKDFFAQSFDEARESQKVGALTEQVIKSTGKSAGVSAKQVGALATAISNKVGIDDEAIQSGENMLLTFRHIRNEAGAGNKIFDQTSRVMVDMASAMAAASGGEVNFRSAAIQIGKALNDPLKGMTALGRAGVQFDAQQQKTIKHLVKQGKTMEAQKVILRELKSEFGGAAAAQATAGDKMEVAWKNLQEQIGTALLPELDKAEAAITKKVIPAVSQFLTEMQNGTGRGGEFVDMVKTLATAAEQDVLPALHDVSTVGRDVLKFFLSLPGPVQKGVVEFGLAAVAIGRVRSAVGGLSLTKFVRDIATADDGTSRWSKTLGGLKSAASSAAGAGGMLLLIRGLKQANDDGSTLASTTETALGGALTGLATGGPLGALVGGGGGLLYALSRGFRNAAGDAAKLAYAATLDDWQRKAADANKGYRDSLNQITGAATKATKATILQELQANGNLAIARQAGISNRQLVDLTLNQGKAYQQVNKWQAEYNRLKNVDLTQLTPKQFKQTTRRMQQLDNLISLVSAVTGANQRNRAEVQKEAIDQGKLQKVLGETKKQYQAIPKKIRSNLELNGLPQTKKDLQGFVKKYGTRSIATAKVIAKVNGLDVTSRQLQQWARSATGTGNTAGRNLTNSAAGAIRKGGGAISGAARGAMTSAGNNSGATGAGNRVGVEYAAGIAAGINSWVGQVANAAAFVVSQAMAAARHAQQSHSPSRKAAVIGREFAQGYGNGIVSGRKKARGAASSLVGELVTALKGGTEGLSGYLDKVGKQIDASYNARVKGIEKLVRQGKIGKARAKAEEKAAKQTEKSMHTQLKATNRGLSAIAKAYGAHLATLQNLQQQRADLISSTASGLTGELDLSSAISEPNQFGFGGGTTTFASVAAVVSGLKSRITQTVALMRQALGAGIPKGLVQEVLNLGTTEAIPVFRALLSGSRSQRASLAQDFNQIGSLSTQAGTILGNAFYSSGIAAQQGILRGLLQDKAINAAAVSLSNKLTKAVKKALGIRSPSRKLHNEVGIPSGQGIVTGAVEGVADFGAQVTKTITKRPLPIPVAATTGTRAGGSTGALTDHDIARLAAAIAQMTFRLGVGERDAVKLKLLAERSQLATDLRQSR